LLCKHSLATLHPVDLMLSAKLEEIVHHARVYQTSLELLQTVDPNASVTVNARVTRLA